MVIVVVALAWDREITIAYTRTYREKQLFQRGEGAWRLRYDVHYWPTNLLPTVTRKEKERAVIAFFLMFCVFASPKLPLKETRRGKAQIKMSRFYSG